MIMPYHKNPAPGAMKFKILVDYLILSFIFFEFDDLCLVVQKKIFKGIMHFHHDSCGYIVTLLQFYTIAWVSFLFTQFL